MLSNKDTQKAERIVPNADAETPDKRKLVTLLTGIFLVSFGMLAFEVSITRVLSVVLSYHYVFAVVSLALLGLGLGAIIDYVLAGKFSRMDKFSVLALVTGLLALSVPVAVLTLARLGASEALRENVPLYLALTTLPFVIAGVLFAELFRAFPASSSKLYGMDLLGAAAGAIGAVVALNLVDGAGALMVTAIAVLAAALIYSIEAFGKHLNRVLPLAVTALLVAGLAGAGLLASPLADFSVGSQDKEIDRFLSSPNLRAEIVETEWSGFGRTDMVAFPDDPARMIIFVDGTAGTSMFRFNGDIKRPDPEILKLQTEFPAFLALAGNPQTGNSNALIIGPGGGRDILLARMAGINNITAVEVNADTVSLVDKYKQYNGGIFDSTNVELVVDEGRSFLKRQKGKYDYIILSLPITKTSRSPEGFALTESFLFTVESINDYYDHLTDDGRLVVVAHGEVETIRLLSVALAALSQRGIDSESAMERISVIGSHNYPAFVLKKTPFKPSEMLSTHRSLHQLGFDSQMSFVPGITLVSDVSHKGDTDYDKCSSFNELFAAASLGGVDFDAVFINAFKDGLDIRPVTDDRPFFYKFEAPMPSSLLTVFWVSVFALVTASAVFYIRRARINSGRKSRDRMKSKGNVFRLLLLFSMIGIGFMLVEISLFQRMTLFLGRPVLSLAALLASLLLGAGAGSLFSGRIGTPKIIQTLVTVSPVIAVVLLLYAFVLPPVLNLLLGLGLVPRLLVAAAALFPLGFLMGFPFPLGMRALKETRLEDGIPWMWGINGIGSVAGSALTIIIAIQFSFTAALLMGALCYFIVFLSFYGQQRLVPQQIAPRPPDNKIRRGVDHV